jgi:hypothetical protein
VGKSQARTPVPTHTRAASACMTHARAHASTCTQQTCSNTHHGRSARTREGPAAPREMRRSAHVHRLMRASNQHATCVVGADPHTTHPARHHGRVRYHDVPRPRQRRGPVLPYPLRLSAEGVGIPLRPVRRLGRAGGSGRTARGGGLVGVLASVLVGVGVDARARETEGRRDARTGDGSVNACGSTRADVQGPLPARMYAAVAAWPLGASLRGPGACSSVEWSASKRASALRLSSV